MKTDTIIVGAGIIGMSLAIALSKNNKKVVIIEKNLKNNLKINRIYSLSEKSKVFFEELDLWNYFTNINELSEMNIYYRNFNNEKKLSFSKKENIDNIGYIAQSKNIFLVLLDKIKRDKNISLIDEQKIENLNNQKNNIAVKLQNNQLINAKYLFSCDGAKSSIKRKLEISNDYDNYDSIAIVFNIEHEIANSSSAFQIFLESGPVAFLPLSDNSFSMVISIKNRFYEKNYYSEKNICSFIGKITNNKFGKIKLKSDLATFDLVGFDTESYVNGSVIFVGDSAHAVHPLAGMGLNLGISDVIEIHSSIKNNKKNFNKQNFFSSYERKQKIVNKKARQQLKIIEKVYSIENKFFAKLIENTMNNINKSEFIKKKIVQHANNNLSFF